MHKKNVYDLVNLTDNGPPYKKYPILSLIIKHTVKTTLYMLIRSTSGRKPCPGKS
ncbi:hypothetical protein KSZ_26200 [Dictyobacter formicarum]|uniref:Uncharacterized protein n=1 Tax=Dictyobacter formicarum TaxID=2778368 RepID=A0ABQ3VEQ4_9CHLR|nr:hypothetical protein KSZ_26200 [Dictyobacter formicarum]